MTCALKPSSLPRPLGRGDHVAHVAEAVLPGDDRLDAARSTQHLGHVADADRLAGADVEGLVRRQARVRPRTASMEARLARATSVTWTKSRIWPPSSNTRGDSPRSREERKIAATPEYGVSRGIRAP